MLTKQGVTGVFRLPAFLPLLLLFLFSHGVASQETGTVTGTVLDASTGELVRRATISVEGQPNFSTVTDLDGNYVLRLPPGAYQLLFAHDNYHEAVVSDIVVAGGAVVEVSTVMSNVATTTVIDVTEDIDAVTATAGAMLTERKLAPTVSDSMSREEIRKSVASDAAGAVEKVTGVSVVDGGYVYVRGLGERYSATMLNRAMVPTTDPERRVVPLDLFPAVLIENIKVVKTYAPDMPGEFSGGLVQMQTIEFPTSRTFNASLSYGFNSQSTFKNFRTHRGGGSDFWGFEDGSRSQPSVLPQERLFPGSFSQEEFQEFGRSFPVNWEGVSSTEARPAQTYSFAGGDTVGPLGLVGAFTFTNKPQIYQETRRYLVNTGGGNVGIFTEYPDFHRGMEASRMGAVLNAALRLNNSNKIVFRNTYTHDADKETRRFEGLNGGIDTEIVAERLRWIERGLFSTGFEGEHSVSALGNSLFRWQYTYSQSSRDEPDFRETIYQRREDGSLGFLSLPQSALRFFNALDDQIHEPLVEWGKPFFGSGVTGMFSLGARATFRQRDFEARRFRFKPTNFRNIDTSLPPNQLLAPENIAPRRFVLRENTRGTDTYRGDMDILGVFAMLDISLGSKWRFAGGIRVEDATIEVTTLDPLVPGGVPAVAELENRDPLPSVNVTYVLTPRQNLRFGYARTLNRPDFRELSPFDFLNVLGGYDTAGNPDLRRAKIDNYDARWEWFLGGNQVIAASYFLKDFTDPIETTIQPTINQRRSFVNAAGARNQGFELEWRQQLGYFHGALEPFTLQSNFTVVDSDVEIPPELALLATSKKRPLLGQSRFIYNFGTEWNKPRWRSTVRFFLNSVSRKITDVGAFSLPDIFQERNTFMDLVYLYSIGERWGIKFTVENLGDNEYLWTQADIVQRRFRIGRTFKVGTSFSLF